MSSHLEEEGGAPPQKADSMRVAVVSTNVENSDISETSKVDHSMDIVFLNEDGEEMTEDEKGKKPKTENERKEVWVMVKTPTGVEDGFEVISMDEVKGAVNDFIVKCFIMDMPKEVEIRNLDDRSLKEIIDKAVVNLKPESTLEKVYRYGCQAVDLGKSAYKFYSYAALVTISAKPMILRIIAEYASFHIRRYAFGS